MTGFALERETLQIAHEIDDILNFRQFLHPTFVIFLFAQVLVVNIARAQVQVNPTEVDLPSQKANYYNALSNGQHDKVLTHLENIRNEYHKQNKWDSVVVYNRLIIEQALPLASKETHLAAFIMNMEIESMFDVKSPADWKERIIHIDQYKEDPELNHFRKWSIYDLLALHAHRNGLPDSAMYLVNRAIYHADLSSEKPTRLAARRKAATFLNSFGRHDEAITYLKWIESSKLFSEEAAYSQTLTFDAMAYAFQEIDDFEKAKYYFNKVIDTSKKNGYTRTLADGYNFLGQLLTNRQYFLEARALFQKAIPIYKDKKMAYEQAECYVYAAATYNQENNFIKSEQYLDSALAMIPTVDSVLLNFIYHREKVETALGVGNVQEAKKHLEKFKSTSIIQKNKNSILNNLAYKVAKAEGKPLVALTFLEAYEFSQDSLRAIYDLAQAQRFESEFNRNIQDEKIAQLDQQKQIQEKVIANRNKNITIAMVFLGIVSILLFFLARLYNRNRRNNKLLKKQNQVIEEALGKNKLLLKEIHHRVKNNLQVISSLLSLQERKVDDVHTKEALKSSKTRVETMSILHQSLYRKEEYRLINAPEYFDKLIANLINTYSLRTDLKTKIDIDDLSFDIETLIPIGLIANELICNALKHGIGNNKNGEIEVSLRAKEDHIILSVIDNGGTIRNDFLRTNKDSIGVKLIKAFANRLDAEVKVSSGTKSTVQVIMNTSTLQVNESQ